MRIKGAQHKWLYVTDKYVAPYLCIMSRNSFFFYFILFIYLNEIQKKNIQSIIVTNLFN